MSELPVPVRVTFVPFDTIPTALSPVITIFPLLAILPFAAVNVVPAGAPLATFNSPYRPTELFPLTVTVPLFIISNVFAFPNVLLLINLSVPYV